MAAVHDGYVLQKSVVHTPLGGRLLSQVGLAPSGWLAPHWLAVLQRDRWGQPAWRLLGALCKPAKQHCLAGLVLLLADSSQPWHATLPPSYCATPPATMTQCMAAAVEAKGTQIRPRYEFSRKEGPGGKLEVRCVCCVCSACCR